MSLMLDTHIPQRHQLEVVRNALIKQKFDIAIDALFHSELISEPAMALIINHPLAFPFSRDYIARKANEEADWGRIHPLEKALCASCFYGKKEKIKMLITLGALQNNPNSKAFSSFFKNPDFSLDFYIPKLLLTSGCTTNPPNAISPFLSIRKSPIFSQTQAISFLIRAGLNPYDIVELNGSGVPSSSCNAFNAKYSSPFCIAARLGPTVVLTDYLKQCPPTAAQLLELDDQKRQAFHWAVSGQDIERINLVADELIKHDLLKTEIHRPNHEHQTPLLMAVDSFIHCIYSSKEDRNSQAPVQLLSRLLELGANPNKITALGTSALEKSLSDDSSRSLSILLEAGGNPNLLNSQQKSLLYQAVEQSNLPAVKVLLKYGADPRLCDSSGLTPLMYLDGKNTLLNTSETQAIRVLLEVAELSILSHQANPTPTPPLVRKTL